MPYVVERQRALSARDIVVILRVHERRVRSRLILRDNSIQRTLTRPKTLVRHLQENIGQQGKGAAWRGSWSKEAEG
jgi:hypothetical protein